MGHCSGGPATDQVDFMTPLVAWVEQGQAPEALVARRAARATRAASTPTCRPDWSADRTRPLCPYPSIARYRGEGSLESGVS